jgi:hypothetical protein
MFDGVLDGFVFRATDVVTFPPDGQGIANAFSTSKCLHFSGGYTDSVSADHCTTLFLFTVTGKLLQKLLSLSRQYV